MRVRPRIALATPSSGPEPAPASLAMLAGLAECGWRVQHFRSRACLMATEIVGRITGLPGRHLDAWLMPPKLCQQVFARGMRQADLALVEGTLEEVGHSVDCTTVCRPDGPPFDRPGGLAPIADALNLPRVALIPCEDLQDFHLPYLPGDIDAVILDGMRHRSEFEPLCRIVHLLLKKPVIGAVEALPEVRAGLRETPRDRPLPQEWFEALAASFLRFADLAALRALARSRPFPSVSDGVISGPGRRFRVAYAQDEAFGGYFPDTLEMLEALGAELVEFSPLRDERLPDAVDLVMIGCGFPDHHAAELAKNVSLIASLRNHVCRGQRIYSEGGGTAYLGRYMILPGRRFRGAGILPFDAELRAQPSPPTPVSRTLTEDGWLGPRGTTVRGYRAERWTLHPAPEPGDCPGRSGSLTPEGDLFFHHHAVGSLIHLHLAALPEVVSAFAGPHRPSLSLPRSRT